MADMNCSGQAGDPHQASITDSITVLLMVIYILAFVFGMVFNLLALGPLIQEVRRRNVLAVYLLSLAVSDLLYVSTTPLWVRYYHLNRVWTMGVASCHLAGFIFYSNMYISILLLCCISADRCLAVTFPLRSKSVRQPRWAWTVSAAVFGLVSLLHAVILAVELGNEAPVSGGDQCYETFPMTRHLGLFNLLRVWMGFLVPLLMLSLCYRRILVAVGHSTSVDAQVKRKVKRMSVGVILIFFLFFGPYHALLAVRSVGRHLLMEARYCDLERALLVPFSCALALSSLNCMANPLLYALVSDSIRHDLQLCCWGRGQRSQETDDKRWRTRVISLS